MSQETVTTDAATSIDQTTVTLNASAASLVVGEWYKVKFSWGETGSPPGNVDYTASTEALGATESYSVNITGLSVSTTYDFKARLYIYDDDEGEYVRVATAASSESFTTLAASVPTVSTGTVANVTTSSGDIDGNDASADGGSTITDKGVCFGTSTDPTTESSAGGGGIGTYNLSKTAGSANTLYYARAYATNATGTAYGANVEFKTTPGKPNATHVTADIETEFKCYWEAGDGGSSGITYRLDVATASDFSTYLAGYQDKDVGSATTHVVTGATDGVTYWFRVRATNSYGAKGGTKGGTNTSVNSESVEYKAGSTLPVELISFTAELEEKSTILNWATASEINNDYFEVERSLDKENFETFAKVEGAGNSNIVLNYSAADNSLSDGVVYYRLKQTDFDGAFEYSSIIAVTRNGEKILIEDYIYDGDRISFNYFNPNNESSTITLVDNMGRIIETLEVNTSSSRIVFNANKLKTGLYVINIVTNNDIIIKKIIL